MYIREGLDWANVDFGMDLQKCIDMFEKPMAFLAIFEEESLFPKATDATFAEKLMTNLLGKWTQFAKPNPRPDPDAHFAVIHYAATVSYNLTGWLEKNKDPLNDTIVELIKNGANQLAIQCFADHPGQVTSHLRYRLNEELMELKPISLSSPWRPQRTRKERRARVERRCPPTSRDSLTT